MLIFQDLSECAATNRRMLVFVVKCPQPDVPKRESVPAFLQLQIVFIQENRPGIPFLAKVHVLLQ